MLPLLLSAAYFFTILTAYYIIRPIRDELGAEGGIENLPWLFTGTLIAMLIANPPFAALVSRFSRRRFVSITYRFFAFNLLAFFLLLKFRPPTEEIWIGAAFFVWVSVFNLFIVSIFWAFMADVFRLEQSKRLFGFIAVGGTMGATLGSAITGWLAVRTEPINLMLVSIVLLEVAVWIVFALSKRFSTLTQQSTDEAGGGSVAAVGESAERPLGGKVLDGIRHVLKSPYLLGICGYILLYAIASTVLYFQQVDIAGRLFADRGERTAFFARVDLAVNALTVVMQIFLTGRIIKWLGVAVTLAILPALSVIGFLALGVWPTIAVIVVFQVCRRAGNFALARPARETLFTVVPRDDKYKAKSFIDTFVYRSGDQIAAWSYAGLSAVGLGLAGIAFLTAPIAGLWLLIGLWLGHRQSDLANARGIPEAGPTRAVASPVGGRAD